MRIGVLWVVLSAAACGGSATPARRAPTAVPAPTQGALVFDLAGAHRDVYFWSEEVQSQTLHHFAPDGTFETFRRDDDLMPHFVAQTDRGTWKQRSTGEVDVLSTTQCADVRHGALSVSFGGCDGVTKLPTFRTAIVDYLARNPASTFSEEQIEAILPNQMSASLYASKPTVPRSDLAGLSATIGPYLLGDVRHRFVFTFSRSGSDVIFIDDPDVRAILGTLHTREELLANGVHFEVSAAEFSKVTAGAKPLAP